MKAHPRVLVVAGVMKVSGDVEVADIGEIGGGAHDAGVFHDDVADASLDVAIFLGGDGASEFHAVAKALVVVHADQGTLLGFDEFVAAGDDAEAVDDEDVGAEVGDALGDVEVEAGDYAHDKDERGDGEDDAEKGEETT